MATSNKELSLKIAKAGGITVPPAFEHDITNWFMANKKRLLLMCGKNEEKAGLFVAQTFAQVNRVPELLNCNMDSIFRCIVLAMGTNLLPGHQGECYFIPYGREATFIPGYQGLVKLAYNSGFVSRISAQIVRENDHFLYDPFEERIEHQYDPFASIETRGARVGVYCGIKNRFGEVVPKVCSEEFINGIKARSPGSKSSFSPWNSKHDSDIDAMWCKTAFKQAAKWIPKDANPSAIALGKAIEADNVAEGASIPNTELLEESPQAVKELLNLSDAEGEIS